jgi:hypothetical protein
MKVRYCSWILLWILLLNTALSSPDPAEVVGETKENAQSIWPRIIKTEGVAIGVALVVTLIAPIFFKIILSCFGFTCRGNVDETLLYD